MRQRSRWVLALAGALLALGGATPAVAADGDIFIDGCLTIDVVAGCTPSLPSMPAGLAESVDGRQLYVAVNTSSPTGFTGLQIFNRDPATGAVAARPGANGCFAGVDSSASCQLITGIDSTGMPRDVAVTPDGRNVYVAAIGNVALLNFARDTTTGALEYRECYGIDSKCTPLAPAGSAYALAVSPNSANLYVRTSGGLAVLDRDPDTLRLQQKAGLAGCFGGAGCTAAAGLAGTSARMRVSPDGSYLYVPFTGPGGIAVFDRLADGRLVANECVSVTGDDGCKAGSLALSVAYAVAVSPDGASVYVGGGSGLVAYRRAGTLTQSGCFGGLQGCTAVAPGIEGVYDIAVTGDGGEVIATPFEANALVAFRRDATGALSRRPGTRGCVSSDGAGCQSLPPLVGSTTLALDPGGLHVYVAGGGVLATLARDFAPSCQAATIDVPHNAPVSVPLTCTDRNGDAIQLVPGASPTGGRLGTVNQAGRSVLYEPLTGFSGTDTFTYQGVARGAASAAATITLRVAGPPTTQLSPPPSVTPTPPPVVAPPPVVGPERFTVTVEFAFRRSTAKSTTFTALTVKNVPKGATVSVTCKGKGCPAKKVKGKRKAVTFTKRNASRTLSLKPWAKASLRTGTALRIVVTKPGSIGMVKTLTVRARKAPRIVTSCLRPGSTTMRTACE